MVRAFIVWRPFLRPWFGLAGERDWPVRTGFAPFALLLRLGTGWR
ncbi:hypothetical protein BH18ACT6_BH18ACT6_10370 [soil metagenome]